MASTVRDVAERAQVSAATVSLVLNGKGGISAETRQRVLTAAADLNYEARPSKANKLAKTTSTARLETLRFLKIARHGSTVNRDHNTFISDYIDGMSKQAAACGYALEVVSFEGTPVPDIVASLNGADLSGVVVLGTELTEADVKLFDAVSVPLVVIDTFYDLLECNFVNMNNKDAVFKALAHFVGRGFRNIGFIASNVQTTNFHLRHEAFVDGMKRFGLTCRPSDIVVVDSTYDGAYRDMLAKLRAGLVVPHGYVCTNDVITYGCIKALREFEVRIPQDLSIIGFDNLPMSATMDPPLTTIDVSKRKIGSLAITLLAENIRSKVREPAVKILVGAELVVRNSVAKKAGQKQAGQKEAVRAGLAEMALGVPVV
jgi:LacI family transcriptional regulator